MDSSDAFRPVIVVGDVHGTLDGLRTILRAANLIDDADRWIGVDSHLIQVGDIVDRGPDPRKCLELLQNLRDDAQAAGGDVTLLLGNHEMSLLQGDYRLSDDSDPLGLAELLYDQARQGRWQAAETAGPFLVTHAGVHPFLLRLLIDEIQIETDQDRVTLRSVANRINAIVSDAIFRDSFRHDLFSVGGSRGGPHPYGGIFWADFDAEHATPADIGPYVRQIFGHTPPLRESDRPFRITPDQMRINVDTGICPYYGGTLGYLQVAPGRVVGVLLGKRPDRQILLGPEDLDGDPNQGQEIRVT